VDSIDESIRAKAQAFTGKRRAAALAIGSNPPGVLVACSSDSGLNAGAILKHVTPRGGGSATLAQGSLPDEASSQLLQTKLGFETSCLPRKPKSQ